MNRLRGMLGANADGSRVALGAATLLVALAVLIAVLTGSARRWIDGTPEQHTVEAVFADTQQLRAGDVVRIDGVTVGRVESLKRSPHGGATTVKMRVDRDAGTLHADARASVRWKTVLGAAFYIGLDRGRAASGTLRAPIPMSRTSSQVEVEDIISVVRDGARRGLQTLPGELARAVRDPEHPAQALDELARVAPSVARGVGALRGTQQDRDLRRLVANSADAVRALDTPGQDIRRLVAGAAATLQTTAARSDELRETIAQAPASLRRTDATLAALDRTLARVDPLAASLRAPAADVAPTLAKLRPTVTDADRLLREARPAVRSLRPALDRLKRAAATGEPLLAALIPSLDRLDNKILPFLNEIDPQTAHSMAQMIGPTLEVVGGGVGQQDANGHFQRIALTAGSEPIALPCEADLLNPDKPSLIACKSLGDLFGTLSSYNPLGPLPGTDPDPTARGAQAGKP